MRCSVRVDGSPFTLNGVTSYFAELNYGSVGFRCVAFHALLAAGVETCSTFQETNNVIQSHFLSCITDSTGASQSDYAFMLTSENREAKKKKKMADQTKLRRWSYLYPIRSRLCSRLKIGKLKKKRWRTKPNSVDGRICT